MEQFEGRVAVVTGAASGIGKALAERFAAEGMKVVLADVEPEPLDAAPHGGRTAGRARDQSPRRGRGRRRARVDKHRHKHQPARDSEHARNGGPARPWHSTIVAYRCTDEPARGPPVRHRLMGPPLARPGLSFRQVRLGVFGASCGVEIDIARPQRAIGKDSTRSARKAYATELRRQIVWEATCPDCRSWWNTVIDIAEYGPEQILGAHQPAVSRVSGQLR